MAKTRIRGEGVSVNVLFNNEPRVELRNIRNFEAAAKLESSTESYLGEKSDRHDDIFRGMRGRFELHFDTGATLDFIRDVITRAQSRDSAAGSVRINISATLRFGDGTRRQVVLPDVFFGEIPIGFASRSDYGAITLDFVADNVRFI